MRLGRAGQGRRDGGGRRQGTKPQQAAKLCNVLWMIYCTNHYSRRLLRSALPAKHSSILLGDWQSYNAILSRNSRHLLNTVGVIRNKLKSVINKPTRARQNANRTQRGKPLALSVQLILVVHLYRCAEPGVAASASLVNEPLAASDTHLNYVRYSRYVPVTVYTKLSDYITINIPIHRILKNTR